MTGDIQGSMEAAAKRMARTSALCEENGMEITAIGIGTRLHRYENETIVEFPFYTHLNWGTLRYEGCTLVYLRARCETEAASTEPRIFPATPSSPTPQRSCLNPCMW